LRAVEIPRNLFHLFLANSRILRDALRSRCAIRAARGDIREGQRYGDVHEELCGVRFSGRGYACVGRRTSDVERWMFSHSPDHRRTHPGLLFCEILAPPPPHTPPAARCAPSAPCAYFSSSFIRGSSIRICETNPISPLCPPRPLRRSKYQTNHVRALVPSWSPFLRARHDETNPPPQHMHLRQCYKCYKMLHLGKRTSPDRRVATSDPICRCRALHPAARTATRTPASRRHRDHNPRSFTTTPCAFNVFNCTTFASSSSFTTSL
jgi:hypothetical protein